MCISFLKKNIHPYMFKICKLPPHTLKMLHLSAGPDELQSAEGRWCKFAECSDSVHCCWGATSWGAGELGECARICVSMGKGLKGSGMSG